MLKNLTTHDSLAYDLPYIMICSVMRKSQWSVFANRRLKRFFYFRSFVTTIESN